MLVYQTEVVGDGEAGVEVDRELVVKAWGATGQPAPLVTSSASQWGFWAAQILYDQ